MINSKDLEFDRDQNAEVTPLEGVPLYRIPERDENFFQRILEKDPDIVFRYHEQRECFDIYYTNVTPDELFWAEVFVHYHHTKMVEEVSLRQYYVRYIPTIYEVKRALRGYPGPVGAMGMPGKCKCDE